MYLAMNICDWSEVFFSLYQYTLYMNKDTVSVTELYLCGIKHRETDGNI